jgi:hypothetical protein
MLGGRSSAYVHVLCAKGFLQRFMPKGRKRSSGITGQSLVSFIEGNGGNGRATAS